MTAVSRTQTLHSDLIEGLVSGGEYRLVPIRDHDALAKSIPGTRPGFIPSGLYGPNRRMPAEPVPTITTTQLLVGRADLPGRVVRDLLEVIYDPRLRAICSTTSASRTARRREPAPAPGGRHLLSPQRSADVRPAGPPVVRRVEHRGDRGGAPVRRPVSAERAVEGAQEPAPIGAREARRNPSARRSEPPIRTRPRQLMRDAHDLLSDAERDAAAGLLDAQGIDSLRSLHHVLVSTQRSLAGGATHALLPAAL